MTLRQRRWCAYRRILETMMTLSESPLRQRPFNRKLIGRLELGSSRISIAKLSKTLEASRLRGAL